jgi:putative transposase
MPARYASVRVHLVWATKRRQPWLDPAWRPRLFGVIAMAVERRGGTLLCAGGVRDHVHLYVELPTTLSVSDMVTSIKTTSSRWVRRTVADRSGFEWQGGYAAFSVNPVDDRELRAYIRTQELHHRERDFPDEYTALLVGHGILFDPRRALD